jgi:hypothetical protein
MKREWTDLEFADWTLLASEAALLANKGSAQDGVLPEWYGITSTRKVISC